MIPTRYIGPLHGFGLTLREEGFRGLYRGYIAYAIATVIYTAVVPILTEITVLNRPISGTYENDVNTLYDEVITKN